MPQVTVYIRKEDLPKWEGVQKKSEFMHNALQAIDIVSSPGKARLYAEIATRKEKEIIKTPKDAKKAVDAFENTGYISKSFSARKKK